MPLNFNVAQDVIDRLAGEDRAGLIFIDEHGHRRDYTFGEIANHSQRYAGALRDLGVTAGERVLLAASNTAKWQFTLLALERLGAVCVPVPGAPEREELLARAQAAAVTTVIANRRSRESFDALRGSAGAPARYILVGEENEHWARLDRLAERAQPLRGTTTQTDDLACIFADTRFDHTALYDSRRRANELLRANASDIVWCTLPAGSIESYFHATLAPWFCGAAAVVHHHPFDVDERLDLVRELNVSVLLQSAAEYAAQIIGPSLTEFRAPHLQRTLCLGEPLDGELADRWQRIVALPLENAGYGIALD